MATVTVTSDNIDALIEENEIVILDFWAEWCGPCRRFGPVFEAASEEHPNIVFGKVDTEDQPGLAASAGVQGIPMLMVFKEKVGIFQQSGALPPPALAELIGQIEGFDMNEVRAKIAEHAAEHESENGQAAEG